MPHRVNFARPADYSTGDYYHYSYDAVGNRKTQETMIGGLLSTDAYNYDDANRLIDVDGVLYTWDDNGNLLNDGVNTYTYDSANRLKTLSGPAVSANYSYNGLGDRVQETLNGQTITFTMDLNMGLTQALNDGTNTYIYGIDRIAQVNTGTEYFLGDALSSVRQMASDSGAITYARAYDPYGVVTTTGGASSTAYGYTGEYTSNNLVYLRARHYAPGMGRFLTMDTWSGDYQTPLTLNRWNYTSSNPINYTDPSGHDPRCFAALGLTMVDGPVLPVGDAAALIICALVIAGVVSTPYIAPSPEIVDIPGAPSVREVPQIYPLEELLKDCWIVIRPNPQRTPDPLPTVYPPPILVTPSVPTPQPTNQPRMLHLALGNNRYLTNFWEKLFLHYLPQNEDVLLYTEWTQEGLTTYGSTDDFNLAFSDAVQHPRVKRIHVNLEGIVPRYATSYRSYIDQYSGGGIWQKPRGRSDDFHVFAWELNWISSNPSLCKNKTIFYEHGSTSLAPSESAKNEICSAATIVK